MQQIQNSNQHKKASGIESLPICNNDMCQLVDVFLTVNSENVDNYKLKELVKQFKLSGDLL